MHILFFQLSFFKVQTAIWETGTIDVTNYTERIVQALADRQQYSAGYWLH